MTLVPAGKAYTAEQYGAALGFSPRAVANRLRNHPLTSTVVTDGGRCVKAWPLPALPDDWIQKLENLSRRANFASVEDWILGPSSLEPEIPFEKLDQRQRRTALQLRDSLAPILSGGHANRFGAEKIRVLQSELASRGIRVSDRTCYRWIELVFARDNGRLQFFRPELYLFEKLKRAMVVSPVTGGVAESPLHACELYDEMKRRGIGEYDARRKILELIRRSPIGVDKSADNVRNTFNRWLDKYHSTGSVSDGRKESKKIGRPRKFKLNKDEQNALRRWRLKKGSLPVAIEFFVDDPDCRPETRAKIHAEMDLAAREKRLPRWPMSIQRSGYVSEDEKALHRGVKHFQEFELIERRGLWINGFNGDEIPVVGNTLWESDDMSSNAPARYLDPETGDTRVGRQLLATMTVYAAAWLGVSPVGRERDAYRLEDIADHLLHVVDAHGLPMIWRFERGPWENQVIDGIKLGDGSRWGDLSPLFRVVHVFKSRSKGLIESSFSLLQSLIDHQSLTIGRSRGEFERATKLFLAAGRGDERAASEFWEIGEMADAYAAAMVRFNDRPKIRRALGRQAVVPADLQRTAEKRECPKSERWRFSPIKRLATARGGAIEVSVNHYPFPFRFRVNGVNDLHLERGYSVLIAFHPGHPEQGCHVFNAELGSRNRDGRKLGEFLMVAPFAEDAPQLNLRPDEYAFAARKNANAAVRSEFRAIVGAGKEPSKVSVRRDGYGNSAIRAEGVAKRQHALATGALSRQDPKSIRADDLERQAREEEELERVLKMEKELRESGDLPL
jgi:hypothetical protein